MCTFFAWCCVCIANTCAHAYAHTTLSKFCDTHTNSDNHARMCLSGCRVKFEHRKLASTPSASILWFSRCCHRNAKQNNHATIWLANFQFYYSAVTHCSTELYSISGHISNLMYICMDNSITVPSSPPTFVRWCVRCQISETSH